MLMWLASGSLARMFIHVSNSTARMLDIPLKPSPPPVMGMENSGPRPPWFWITSARPSAPTWPVGSGPMPPCADTRKLNVVVNPPATDCLTPDHAPPAWSGTALVTCKRPSEVEALRVRLSPVGLVKSEYAKSARAGLASAPTARRAPSACRAPGAPECDWELMASSLRCQGRARTHGARPCLCTEDATGFGRGHRSWRRRRSSNTSSDRNAG